MINNINKCISCDLKMAIFLADWIIKSVIGGFTGLVLCQIRLLPAENYAAWVIPEEITLKTDDDVFSGVYAKGWYQFFFN